MVFGSQPSHLVWSRVGQHGSTGKTTGSKWLPAGYCSVMLQVWYGFATQQLFGTFAPELMAFIVCVTSLQLKKIMSVPFFFSRSLFLALLCSLSCVPKIVCSQILIFAASPKAPN